jgi:hypothetical protein
MSALGLLVLGLALRYLPDRHPGWFPGNGWDGTNARAIWLVAMGTITAGFGAYYLIKLAVIPFFWRWAVLRPAREKAAVETQAKLEPPLVLPPARTSESERPDRLVA